MRAMKTSWFGAAAVAVAMVGAPAVADEGAEAFVSTHANEALSILSDASMPLAEKKEHFRALVDEIADVPRVTRFVLGRYARDADPAEMEEFSEVFRDYAIGVYENRLGDYAGETLHVTGSTDRNERDVIVHTEIEGGAQEDELPVNWRVLTGDDGSRKVVDVEVYGVWLAINQREEIVGIIQANNGSIAAASRSLREQAAEQAASD